MNTEYEKFGGWLLVYLSLTVLGILVSIPSLFVLLRLGLGTFSSFINIHFLILFVSSLLALLLQFVRVLILPKNNSKTYQNLILIQFGEIGLALITILLSFSTNLTYLISNIIVSVLWLMYLRSSIRVKTFYKLDSR